ncbi:GNAT family N-acetyltransferase [Hirschia baltica]|uniref:GCN5-related N-acetyltransferase n=1 Tax=Hirschia baltica (strain ATCC 49814 / DSM 5838 / IFAM 1418) TaxID=582402 RepID=C6XLR4_HIRBI|nr:GNAT family N-acetyltransferase [Hirschia baltica]ACT57970.1 GCN5-related N-acetyltransferase [Hirschia baltica ATCC 49814]
MAYTIEILPDSKADLDAVGQLIYDSIHALAGTHYSPEQLNAWAPNPYAGERARKRFGDQLFFIASDDDGIAALMTLTPEHHLDFAYAHPRSAGKGAAAQAYSSLETYARGQNINAITSDVSLVARPFFEKRGYKTLAKQHPIANGVALINFKMRKEFS